MKQINWNEKTSEKDFVIAILIIAGIAIAFFIYMNIPKNNEIKADIIEITSPNLTSQSISEKFINPALIDSKKTVNYQSNEGKNLLSKYKITKIPSLIIKSKNIQSLELDKNLFEIKDNTAILRNSAPYLDLNTNQIKGLVTLTIIKDSSCTECFDMSIIEPGMQKAGIVIKNTEIIDSLSEQGKELIKNNNIKTLPALIISDDIKEYIAFSELQKVLEKQNDGYKLSQPVYPYKEITTGKIKGKITVTYITNESCSNCPDITQATPTLENLGFIIVNEKFLNLSSNEAKQLITKYNIAKFPTFILSPEVSDYDLKDLLSQLGTFEKDSSFVFRETDKLQSNQNGG